LAGYGIFGVPAQIYNWAYGDIKVFSGFLGLDIFLAIFALLLPVSSFAVGLILIKRSFRQSPSYTKDVKEKKNLPIMLYPWIVMLIPLIILLIIPDIEAGGKGWLFVYYFIYLFVAIPAALFTFVADKSNTIIINILISVPLLLAVYLFIVILTSSS